MNVAFIVTSYWAYGELLIALEFAKRIEKQGYKPYFFIPPSHEKIVKSKEISYSVLMPHMGKINRILFQDYESNYKPKFVILADFINYNFCERHYGLTVEDLKIFSGAIGTFDDFDWTLAKRDMDTYGFKAKNVSEVDISQFGFKLLPCPIDNPLKAEGAEKDKFYYALTDNLIEYNDTLKTKYRRELGLPEDKPITLVTSAVWQETHKAYPDVINFVNTTNRIYSKILSSTTEDGILLYVGPKGSLDERYISSNVYYLNQLQPSDFDKYAAASDLFVARNITSTTLAKLALAGIPTISLKNSINFNDKNKHSFKPSFEITDEVKEALEGLDRCYQYRMFPVGWHTFLGPTLKENPYLDLVKEIEIFDENKAKSAIKNILNKKSERDIFKEKAEDYNKIISKLKTPAEILANLI